MLIDFVSPSSTRTQWKENFLLTSQALRRGLVLRMQPIASALPVSASHVAHLLIRGATTSSIAAVPMASRHAKSWFSRFLECPAAAAESAVELITASSAVHCLAKYNEF